MRRAVLNVCVVVLTGPVLLSGCRNPHAHIDRLEQQYQDAVDRYEQDCPASATAGNEEKTRECQAEHADVETKLRKLQAAKSH